MKILQLCNKIPYPPHDGGAIAILNLSKSLALEGHKITVLAMNTSKHYTASSIIPDKLTSLIKFIYVPVDTKIRPLKLLINFFFSDSPYIATRFESNSFQKALYYLLTSETFDIIQLEGLYLKSYLALIRQHHQGLVAYRAHNVECEIWIRLASQTQNLLRKFYLQNLARRIEAYEKDFVNQYDILLPITNEDMESLRKMGNSKPAEVIATGFPEEDFVQETSKESANSLYFIGALDWIPNQEGLLWFINTVWVKLLKLRPAPEFHVAGRNAPKWLAKKIKEKGIIFHGEIPDAHKFMDAYNLMVVPLFTGSGLRIKIIEAMTRSKAIITTPVGAQGLGIRNGGHAIIVDDEEGFYNSITHLFAHQEDSLEMRKNAYLFASENFSNKKIAGKLLDFYQMNKVC